MFRTQLRVIYSSTPTHRQHKYQQGSKDRFLVIAQQFLLVRFPKVRKSVKWYFVELDFLVEVLASRSVRENSEVRAEKAQVLAQIELENLRLVIIVSFFTINDFYEDKYSSEDHMLGTALASKKSARLESCTMGKISVSFKSTGKSSRTSKISFDKTCCGISSSNCS